MTDGMAPGGKKQEAAAGPGAAAGRAATAARRLVWLLPVLVVLAVYGVALDNFFAYDDFIWLNRARSFSRDWQQIFRPDVTYFDPLVHLLFLLDRAVAGVEPRWYHGVDLALHAVNALLVYRLARLLSADPRAPLYAALLFAGSFAVADAVLWPSSRVDLLATLFSLAASIQFLHFLREERRGRLYLSLVLFLLALCAKGTPLVLPAFLFWLLLQEGQPLRRALCLVPFAAALPLFLLLLKLNMHRASLPLNKLQFSVENLALSFSALFVPETVLKEASLPLVSTLLLVLVSALGLVALSGDRSAALRRSGYLLLVLALLPVLVITDLKPLGEYSDPVTLLVSPSHRIYLAAAGGALLCGGLLGSLEALLGRRWPRLAGAAAVLALCGVLLAGVYLVRERDRVWEGVGERSRAAFQGLQAHRGRVPEGSQLGLIYFPGSSGFMTPLVQLALDLDQVDLLKNVFLGLIPDREILGRAERSFLFVLDREGRVRDKSELYRQMLLLNRMLLIYPERPELVSQFEAVAWQLSREIE